MTDQTTIADLAHKAVATPDTLTHADIVRLGAWVVDHDEHITSFKRDAARGSAPSPDPSRIERLGEAARTNTQAPARSMLPLPEQHDALQLQQAQQHAPEPAPAPAQVQQ